MLWDDIVGRKWATGETVVNSYTSFPKLTAAAIKAKQWKKGLRYWYLAHEVLGNHTKPVAQKVVRDIWIQNFGITERYAHYIIEQGKGTFWQTTERQNNVPGTLKLIPTYQLIKILTGKTGEQLGHQVLDRPVKELQDKTLQSIYEHLREDFITRASSYPARETLETATGIKQRTQQYYDNCGSGPNSSERRKCWQLERVASSITEARRMLTEGIAAGVFKKFVHMIQEIDLRPRTIFDEGERMTVYAVVKRLGNEYIRIPLKKYMNAVKTFVGRNGHNSEMIWVRNEDLFPFLKLECAILHPPLFSTN